MAQEFQRSHLKHVFMWPWNKGKRSSINPEVDKFPCFWIPKNLYISLQYLKKWLFNIFSHKCIKKSIWPFHRKFKGQLRNIIWMKLTDLESHWFIPSFKIPSFSVIEKIFKGFFFIYGHGSHLGQQTGTSWTNFRSPRNRLNIKYSSSAVKSSEMWICVTLKQKSKVICWPWHWYISMFLVNKVCVPDMIHQLPLVLDNCLFTIFPIYMHGKDNLTFM